MRKRAERTLSGRLKPSVLLDLELPEARALANSSFCLESSALRLKKVLEDTEVDLVLLDEAIEFTSATELNGSIFAASQSHGSDYRYRPFHPDARPNGVLTLETTYSLRHRQCTQVERG